MFDMSYLALIVVTLVIGLGAQGYVNYQLKKYSNVPVTSGITGAEAARRMLAYYGVTDVEIRRGGQGQDFFDPRSNSVTLSPDAFGATSVTALATACHEVGHACQYAQRYMPMRIRTAIVPVANFASNAWVFVLMIGIVMNLIGLVDVAIVLYAAVVLFSIVTLPVEFNASRRAITYMGEIALPASEQKGAFSVLRACALTYVAAALSSVLQLLWLLGRRD